MKQTIINLGRAFTGESAAHMRYVLYARTAKSEALEAISRIFHEVAANELAHAKIFLDLIGKHNPGAVNQNIDAGFPMLIGDTLDNLGSSAHGEHEEYTCVYPSFAEIATAEGFEDVARAFRGIAEIENTHYKEFSRLHTLLSEGRLYSSAQPLEWRCIHCGHILTGTQPWVVCPVCSHPQGYVAIPAAHK